MFVEWLDCAICLDWGEWAEESFDRTNWLADPSDLLSHSSTDRRHRRKRNAKHNEKDLQGS